MCCTIVVLGKLVSPKINIFCSLLMINIKKKKKEDDLIYLERVYTTILKKNPASFLYLPLASVYYRKGDIESAINILLDNLSVHSNYVTAKSYLAFLYSKTGESDESIELFKNIVFLSPDNYAAHKALADYYIKKEDEKNALMELKELSRLSPSDKMVQDKIKLFEKGFNKSEVSSISKNGKLKKTGTKEKKFEKIKPRLVKKLEKNKEKLEFSEKIIPTLENWLKSIDKISYKV